MNDRVLSESEVTSKLNAAITVIRMGVEQGSTRWTQTGTNGPTLFDVYHDAIQYVDEVASSDVKALSAKLKLLYARL